MNFIKKILDELKRTRKIIKELYKQMELALAEALVFEFGSNLKRNTK